MKSHAWMLGGNQQLPINLSRASAKKTANAFCLLQLIKGGYTISTLRKKRRIPWTRQTSLDSMDWFVGENLNRKPGFLPSNLGVSGSNFPVIQFCDRLSTSKPSRVLPAQKFGPTSAIRYILDERTTIPSVFCLTIGYPKCSRFINHHGFK